jgi:hypothetical protein
MAVSIVLRRPDAGASTAQSPAQRPGEGDDGGVACHAVNSMHALFSGEVQSFLRNKKAALVPMIAYKLSSV